MKEIGILSICHYLPKLRVSTVSLSHFRRYSKEKHDILFQRTGVEQCALPLLTEDAATMGVEAAFLALKVAQISADDLDFIFLSSESLCGYKMKPISAIIARILGCRRDVAVADVSLACAGPIMALWMAKNYIKTAPGSTGLVVGADVALYESGAAELTQGAGTAVAVVSDRKNVILKIGEKYNISDDVYDLFKRDGAIYPMVFGVASVEAYKSMCSAAINGLLDNLGRQLSNYDAFIFHNPFPRIIRELFNENYNVSPDWLSAHVLRFNDGARTVGNLYTASLLYHLSLLVPTMEKDWNIVACGYGSGASAMALNLKCIRKPKHSIQDGEAPSPTVLKAPDYLKWKRRYIRLRKSGGQLVSGWIRGQALTDDCWRIRVCEDCGTLHGNYYPGRCIRNNCRGTLLELLFPKLVQVDEWTPAGTEQVKIYAPGLMPTSIDSDRLLPGDHAKSKIRVVEIQGNNGPIIHGPVWLKA